MIRCMKSPLLISQSREAYLESQRVPCTTAMDELGRLHGSPPVGGVVLLGRLVAVQGRRAGQAGKTSANASASSWRPSRAKILSMAAASTRPSGRKPAQSLENAKSDGFIYYRVRPCGKERAT